MPPINGPISYVKCGCIALLQPLHISRGWAHARALSAAHGICGILKEEREKNLLVKPFSSIGGPLRHRASRVQASQSGSRCRDGRTPAPRSSSLHPAHRQPVRPVYVITRYATNNCVVLYGPLKAFQHREPSASLSHPRTKF